MHGAELSYNNLMDADSAWRTVSDFAGTTVAIIKHSNPCGLASRDEQVQAYLQAYEGDTVSAFGGIVAFKHHGHAGGRPSNGAGVLRSGGGSRI